MAKSKKQIVKQTKAGRLLSKYITQISSEKTELVSVEGEDKMVTKAEALARLIWKTALGYSTTVIEGITAKEIIHPPSLAHQSIILERIEGKAALAPELPKSDKQNEIADRIAEEVAKRINDI